LAAPSLAALLSRFCLHAQALAPPSYIPDSSLISSPFAAHCIPIESPAPTASNGAPCTTICPLIASSPPPSRPAPFPTHPIAYLRRFYLSLARLLSIRRTPHAVRFLCSSRIHRAVLCPDPPRRCVVASAIKPAMPAADPADQQAARAIESSLCEAVTRRERPPVELDWLLALPKRIRRSGKLLEAAQLESRVLLEHVRSAWTKAVSAELKQEARLARSRALPRDLECLRAPDPAASQQKSKNLVSAPEHS
ncbi:hypothetical protein FRC06_011104, partial [Ceratobasidium sp. 370]